MKGLEISTQPMIVGVIRCSMSMCHSLCTTIHRTVHSCSAGLEDE